MPLVELALIQHSPYLFATECGNCLFHALRTSIYELWPLLVLRFVDYLVLIQRSPYFFVTECGHCLMLLFRFGQKNRQTPKGPKAPSARN